MALAYHGEASSSTCTQLLPAFSAAAPLLRPSRCPARSLRLLASEDRVRRTDDALAEVTRERDAARAQLAAARTRLAEIEAMNAASEAKLREALQLARTAGDDQKASADLVRAHARA